MAGSENPILGLWVDSSTTVVQCHNQSALLWLKHYGKLQCYSIQSCSARIIAGNKHHSKNTPNTDLTIYIVSKYLCVDMAICDSQKYFMLI